MYSTQMAKDRGLQTKIRRAKIQAGGHAKGAVPHPDYMREHPSEVREVATGKFTELTKRLKEEHQKHLEEVQSRREKLGDRI
jgi:uncharacterized protein YbjQ (UPF0145 family)